MPKRASHRQALPYTRRCCGRSISWTRWMPSPRLKRMRKAKPSPSRVNAPAHGQGRAWTMTSEAPAECFVYITLPGQTEPVTAGRFALSVDRRGTPEGRFVYGRSYLERPNAVALDPVELKLSTRTYATASLGGVFGALRDASPDYWGRRVIQRHLGKAQPGEMEYLLYSPDDRAGALGFGLNQT